MIAPDLATPQPAYVYESPDYRSARQREKIAAIMAALRAGKTNREIAGDEGEERGDD